LTETAELETDAGATAEPTATVLIRMAPKSATRWRPVFEANIVILPFSPAAFCLAGHASPYSSNVPIAVFRQKFRMSEGLAGDVGENPHRQLADFATGTPRRSKRWCATSIEQRT
jgi:hypothetical protein